MRRHSRSRTKDSYSDIDSHFNSPPEFTAIDQRHRQPSVSNLSESRNNVNRFGEVRENFTEIQREPQTTRHHSYDLLELPITAPVDPTNNVSLTPSVSKSPSIIGRSFTSLTKRMQTHPNAPSNVFMAERGSLAVYESADTDDDQEMKCPNSHDEGFPNTNDSWNLDHDEESQNTNNMWNPDPKSEISSLDTTSFLAASNRMASQHNGVSNNTMELMPSVITSSLSTTAGLLENESPFSATLDMNAINVAGETHMLFNNRINEPRTRFGRIFKCIEWHARAFWWRIQFFIAPDRVCRRSRHISLHGTTSPCFFPPNIVCNQQYNFFTLVPLVLYDQFRFFFNVFYLMVALAQFIPQLKVGPLFTYVAPLSLVLIVTITKEAYDDYKRKLRDQEANSAKIEVLDRLIGQLTPTPAAQIKVGDIIKLHTDQRVPCDTVLLKTSNSTGTTFIRTDQLDGETDWKLRRAVAVTQSLSRESDLFQFNGWMSIEAPRQNIYDFVGTFYHAFSPESPFSFSDQSSDSMLSSWRVSTNVGSHRVTNGERGIGPKELRSRGSRNSFDIESHAREIQRIRPKRTNSDVGMPGSIAEPLGLENTMFGTTVVTEGPVWALAIYTGRDVRSSLNTSTRETKTGLFDLEVNRMSKSLFAILLLASAILVAFKGFSSLWFVYFCRFVLLLSSIIPISLRVNLELAKAYYAYTIQNDAKLGLTVVRNSSIPEELGRVEFLLTDKTGTLTQNEMVFKKLHIGRVQFCSESLEEIKCHLKASFDGEPVFTVPRRRLEVWDLLRRTLIGLSVCHNVTPVKSELADETTFQASSPDEIALVKFVSTAGLRLVERSDSYLKLIAPDETELAYDILYCFPFSSETKRMGCIVRLKFSNEIQMTSMGTEVGKIFFFLKGAESVMIERVEQRGSHWLQEECDNFARVGLRTLVIAVRELSPKQFEAFKIRYNEAQTSLSHRAQKIRMAIDSLEVDMVLLGLTGVEDKLQQDVPQTLEAFRHAGIRVWMLTGDKIETATSIAVAAGLKARQYRLLTLAGQDFDSPAEAQEALEAFSMGPTETILVIDGPFIELVVQTIPEILIRAACQAPSVICCRCSPTQKEIVVRLIQKFTGKRCAAIGDGGNDVSMIQAANCGIGIVGKEGRQASLAADFSIPQFGYLHRLLFWHGRNCYQRSAKLAHFVIHRGLIIATIQVIFSAIFFFIPLGIFQGWLTVGYATYYTMLPVFSLVLDIELPESVVFMFPELYDSLRSGRVMSSKTFFAWLWTSIYQGVVIMLGAILLFESDFTNIVAITFTSLILSELLNVASEITNWHGLMIGALIVTVIIYFASMALLPQYFSLSFILSIIFWWKVATITLVSWLPLYFFKVLMKFIQPTRDSKLTF